MNSEHKGELEASQKNLELEAEAYHLETKYRTPSSKRHFIAGANSMYVQQERERMRLEITRLEAIIKNLTDGK